MSHTKLIAAVALFFCFVMSTQLSYASEKYVFVINEQDNSGVQAYKINGSQVSLQGAAYLLNEDGGTIALAAWPQRDLLFATYDYSSIITWVSTKTLAELGQYTEPNVSPYGTGFAGIQVDAAG